MTEVISCPRCHGEMAQGYILDFTPVGGQVTLWNAGAPQKVDMVIGSVIKDSTTQIPIGTFRCRSCGFLDFYAREEFAAR